MSNPFPGHYEEGHLKGEESSSKKEKKGRMSKEEPSSAKGKALKKAYTGHYQETGTGQIRHQSPKQADKKKLRHGPSGMYN